MGSSVVVRLARLASSIAMAVALVGCPSVDYVVVELGWQGAAMPVDTLQVAVRDAGGVEVLEPRRLTLRAGQELPVEVLFEIHTGPGELTFEASAFATETRLARCSTTARPVPNATVRASCALAADDEAPLATRFDATVTALAPVAWYRLGRDDLGGTVAHDATTRARHGTYGSGARPGAFGAIAGDGDTAASVATRETGVIALGPSLVDWNASFTVALWLRLHHRPPPGERAAVFVQDGGFAMTVEDDQRLHVRTAAGAPIASGDIVPVGRWTMVSASSTPSDGLVSTGTTARIGDDDDVPLDADIDEVLIFDRVVEAADLEALRAAATRGAVAPSSCARRADIDAGSGVGVQAATGQLIDHVTVRVAAGGVGVRVGGVANVVVEDVRFEVEPGGVAVEIEGGASARLERVEVRGGGAALVTTAATGLRVRSLVADGPVTLGSDTDAPIIEDVVASRIVLGAAGAVRRALVSSDGTPGSVGVAAAAGSAIEDLDVIGASLACLTLDGGDASTIDGLRCRDTRCAGGDSGEAVRFSGGATASIEGSVYFGLCGLPTNDGVDHGAGLRVEDFAARAAPTPRFCWE